MMIGANSPFSYKCQTTLLNDFVYHFRLIMITIYLKMVDASNLLRQLYNRNGQFYQKLNFLVGDRIRIFYIFGTVTFWREE